MSQPKLGVRCAFRARTESRRLQPRDTLSSSNLTLAMPFSTEPSQRSGRIALIKIAPKIRAILQDRRRNRCPEPCKVLGPDRTKMFHVKHSCKVRAADNEPRLVGLRMSRPQRCPRRSTSQQIIVSGSHCRLYLLRNNKICSWKTFTMNKGETTR